MPWVKRNSKWQYFLFRECIVVIKYFFILFGLRKNARSVLNSSRREDVLLIYFEQIFTCEKIHVWYLVRKWKWSPIGKCRPVVIRWVVKWSVRVTKNKILPPVWVTWPNLFSDSPTELSFSWRAIVQILRMYFEFKFSFEHCDELAVSLSAPVRKILAIFICKRLKDWGSS